MAHVTSRTLVFKIDNASASLTDISGSVNQQNLAKDLGLLEDTGLGDTDRTYVPGLEGATLPVNGYMNSTTEAIVGPLVEGTSITKTVSVFDGYQYLTGEVWPANVTITGNVGELVTWSMDLTFSGAVDRTSVAPS